MFPPPAAPQPQVQWRALDEIDAGICDGMTYAGIAEKYPDEFAARKADKLRYRCGGVGPCVCFVRVRRGRRRRGPVLAKALLRLTQPGCYRAACNA